MEQMKKTAGGTRRIRSISQTIEFFKQIDPQTAVKYSTLKRVVDNGEIPHINAGSRRLIVLEDAYEYFYGVSLNETVGSGMEVNS